MRQAIHILRKDVRYLWIETTVALIAAGLLAFTGVRQAYALTRPEITHGIATAAMLLPFLLPIAWWTLIVRAVYAETLTGDRQFWPTRPYAWRSLLAAKWLLILLFVNMPLFLAQTAIVLSAGFPLSPQLAGLLWTQVLLTVAFDLPVAAVAALTTGVVQFLLCVLIVFASSMALSMGSMRITMAFAGGGWRGMEWIETYYSLLLIAIVGAAILIWQYRTRRTVPARVLAGLALLILALGAPFSWSTAFAIQSHFSRLHVDEASLHAGLFTNFQWATRAIVNRDGSVSLHIPLELSGVPGDLEPRTEGLTVRIEGAGGAIWDKNEAPWAEVSTNGRLIALQTTVDGAFYQKVKDQPVSLRGYLYLTLYGNQRVTRVPFDDHTQPVPGLGLCSASGGGNAPYFLSCNSTFRPPSELVSVAFGEGPNEGTPYSRPQVHSYSPLPAELSLNPVNPFVQWSTSKKVLDAATVVSVEPLAHVRAAIAIDGLRLGEHEVRIK